MSQDELGRRVGISRPMVSLIERGQVKNPRIPMLTAIAKALDIPPAQMFATLGINADVAGASQLVWLAQQLDPGYLRMLTTIGHALLQEQHDSRESEGRSSLRR